MFVTATGAVKRTASSEFAEASGRQNGIVAMKLAADDRIVAVFPGWDDYELLLVTANGQGIRFAEDDVRPVGRSAGGIRGIRLKGDDRVVGACAVAHEEIVVIATEQGFAKRTERRRVPGAGARRLGIEGGEDRQGARAAGRGRDGRGRARVPHRRRHASSCPAQGVRAAGRDGGGSKMCPAGLQRVVAVASSASTRRDGSGQRGSRRSASRGS